MWVMKRRIYSFGRRATDENDFGRGANELYRAVMLADDQRAERARIRWVLCRLSARAMRFVRAVVVYRLSRAQVCQQFRINAPQFEIRLGEAETEIVALKLPRLYRPFRTSHSGLKDGCTMSKQRIWHYKD